MKKFYKSVAVSQNEAGQYQILLDNRPLKTPLKKDLHLSSQEIANLIAKEWDQDVEEIDVQSMRFMSLVATYIDKITGNEEFVKDQVLAFIDSDSILFFSDEEKLRVKQETSWAPILKAFKDETGLSYEIVTDLSIPSQDKEIHAFWKSYLSDNSGEVLNAFQYGTSLIHSPLLIWAYRHNYISLEELYEFALLEELHQVELWGEDHEAKKRRQGIKQDLEALCAYIDLC